MECQNAKCSKPYPSKIGQEFAKGLLQLELFKLEYQNPELKDQVASYYDAFVHTRLYHRNYRKALNSYVQTQKIKQNRAPKARKYRKNQSRTRK